MTADADLHPIERSWPIWQEAVGYYISGRFSAYCDFPSTAAVLFHHAVEMLMKAGIVRNDTQTPDAQLDTMMRKTYRHDLAKLWAKIRELYPNVDLSAHDRTIERLNPFEDIRYPDYKSSKLVCMMFGEDEQPPFTQMVNEHGEVAEFYFITVGEVDRVFNRLWKLFEFPVQALKGTDARNEFLIQPAYALKNAHALYKADYYWAFGREDGTTPSQIQTTGDSAST